MGNQRAAAELRRSSEVILVSGLQLGPWMDEVYQQHFIRTDARGTVDGWWSVVQVSWKEGDVTKVRLWPAFGHGFTSRAQAEREARSVAKKWIDEGKPEIETRTYAGY